jgi:hypothetical protein
MSFVFTAYFYFRLRSKLKHFRLKKVFWVLIVIPIFTIGFLISFQIEKASYSMQPLVFAFLGLVYFIMVALDYSPSKDKPQKSKAKKRKELLLTSAFVIIMGVLQFKTLLTRIHSDDTMDFLREYLHYEEADEISFDTKDGGKRKLDDKEAKELINNITPFDNVESLKDKWDIIKCEPKDYAVIEFYDEGKVVSTFNVVWLSNEEKIDDELEDNVYIINDKKCILRLRKCYCVNESDEYIDFDI